MADTHWRNTGRPAGRQLPAAILLVGTRAPCKLIASRTSRRRLQATTGVARARPPGETLLMNSPAAAVLVGFIRSCTSLRVLLTLNTTGPPRARACRHRRDDRPEPRVRPSSIIRTHAAGERAETTSKSWRRSGNGAHTARGRGLKECHPSRARGAHANEASLFPRSMHDACRSID